MGSSWWTAPSRTLAATVVSWTTPSPSTAAPALPRRALTHTLPVTAPARPATPQPFLPVVSLATRIAPVPRRSSLPCILALCRLPWRLISLLSSDTPACAELRLRHQPGPRCLGSGPRHHQRLLPREEQLGLQLG